MDSMMYCYNIVVFRFNINKYRIGVKELFLCFSIKINIYGKLHKTGPELNTNDELWEKLD